MCQVVNNWTDMAFRKTKCDWIIDCICGITDRYAGYLEQAGVGKKTVKTLKAVLEQNRIR